MSIRCRCLLVLEGAKPVRSDKDLRLPPRSGDGVQFEEVGTLHTFRVERVLHVPGLDGIAEAVFVNG